MHKKVKFALLVIFTLLAIDAAAFLLIPSDNQYYDKITNHIYDFNSLIVVLTVLATWFSMSKQHNHLPWLFLLMGVSGWFMGDLIWTAMIYLGIDPFPSIADAFYILGHLSILAAVVTKFLHVRKESKVKDIWNGIFVGGSLLAIAAIAVLAPIALSDETIIAKVVMIFYPIADAITITLAVIVISAIGNEKSAIPWTLICLGLALWIAADTLAAYLEWGDASIKSVDLIFLAGILLIGFGAFYRRLLNRKEIFEKNT